MTVLQIPTDKLEKMLSKLVEMERNSIYLKDWFLIRNKINHIQRVLNERR